MNNNKDIVLQFQLAASKKVQGEDADISPYLADDIVWHLPQSLEALANGADKVGIDGITQMLTKTVRVFYKPETMNFQFYSMIADGDYVHMHFGLSAEAANGQPYNNRYQSLFRLSHGKIAEVWEYFDSAAVVELLNQK